jgi:ferric-dicitrate binding protein FerR (iron transport regulator)
MEETNDSNILFKKLLNNSITEEELQVLLKYVRTSDQKNEINRLMADHWKDIQGKLIENETGLQTDDRYAEILRKLNPVKNETEKDNHDQSPWPESPLRWIGIAASILIILSIGLYWNISSSKFSEIPVNTPLTSQYFSGKQVVNLPDGSTIILNEVSQLSYPETFGETTREVIFSGQGYFDIAHDSEKPFIVHTDQVKTTVLGTAFNLIAYQDQSEVVVTVARGEVAVGDDKRNYDHIFPNQQLVVDKKTRKFEKGEVDLERVLAWKEKFLILDGLTVTKALELIGSRHEVKITIANDEMQNCRINAAFMKEESLEQILRVVCGVLQAEFTIDGNKVEITGGRKCN